MRIRVIVFLARRFGTRAVADLVQALEGDEEDIYNDQSSPEVASIAADEREHAEIWRRLDGARTGGNGSVAVRDAVRGRGQSDRDSEGLRRARTARSPDEIVRGEQWHRAGQSGHAAGRHLRGVATAW